MTILGPQLPTFPLSGNHATNAHDIDSGKDGKPIISKEYYLFGHPISHSASPRKAAFTSKNSSIHLWCQGFLLTKTTSNKLDFHNLIWSKLYPDRRYLLCDTANLTHEQIAKKINSNPKFDGAAITMPLKSMVMKIPGVIDRLTPSALATGAVVRCIFFSSIIDLWFLFIPFCYKHADLDLRIPLLPNLKPDLGSVPIPIPRVFDAHSSVNFQLQRSMLLKPITMLDLSLDQVLRLDLQYMPSLVLTFHLFT